MKKHIAIIHRKKKIEAVRAMTDLVERGYTVVLVNPFNAHFDEIT